MTLTLKGDVDLVADLAKIGTGLDRLDTAARRSAELLAQAASARAPKRTGKLARSIVGRAQGGKASVGTPVSYGLPVHFGVPSRGQRPQPFLADAIRSQSRDVVRVYETDVQDLIDQVT